MGMAQDTLRVLRGEKGSIRSQWQTEAQARLWHLNPRLLSGRSPVQQCITSTLSQLAAFFERLNGLEQEATASDSQDAMMVLLDPICEGSDSEWNECAARWAALPVAWADVRTMLRILTVSIHRTLSEKCGRGDGTSLCLTVLNALAALAAEQRMREMEQQANARQEEHLLSQHLSGRFLANASHELRTPLTAVLGFSDLLLENTYGPLTDAQRTAIGHIENSAQNLLEIVNNLLDLLKVRSGELKLLYHQVILAPLLHDLYKILLPLAERKKVHFTLDISDSLGAIEADENIIRHILYHLLTSSLRATPAHGGVEVGGQRSAEAVTILIRDTALHLPPEAIANMMEAFPRLENSPARGFEGWEVGIPLVRRYIDLHGGQLHIESLPERGTVFHVILPLLAARDGASSEPSRIMS